MAYCGASFFETYVSQCQLKNGPMNEKNNLSWTITYWLQGQNNSCWPWCPLQNQSWLPATETSPAAFNTNRKWLKTATSGSWKKGAQWRIISCKDPQSAQCLHHPLIPTTIVSLMTLNHKKYFEQMLLEAYKAHSSFPFGFRRPFSLPRHPPPPLKTGRVMLSWTPSLEASKPKPGKMACCTTKANSSRPGRDGGVAKVAKEAAHAGKRYQF